MDTHARGNRYEDAAADFLLRAGYRILARNFRVGRNEIDIIVECAGTVAFVEVKGRCGEAFGHPLDAITAPKRRDIARVARGWIGAHGGGWREFRYDAVAVFEDAPGELRVEHVQDAWR